MGEVKNFCLNNGEKQFIAVRIASQLFFFFDFGNLPLFYRSPTYSCWQIGNHKKE